jgi:hypothetical protein
MGDGRVAPQGATQVLAGPTTRARDSTPATPTGEPAFGLLSGRVFPLLGRSERTGLANGGF